METKTEILQKYFNVSTALELRLTHRHWSMPDRPADTKYYNMKFPYERASLPYPIPKPRELKQFLKSGDLTGGRPWGAYIIQVNDAYAVKFGASESLLQEAENMLYIEQHTTVRAPKVYAAFSDDSVNPITGEHDGAVFYYIVMDCVKGTQLLKLWGEMAENRQREVAVKLADQLMRLRSVSLGSEFYYGRIEKQTMSGWINLFRKGKPLQEPYLSYDELLSDIVMSAKLNVAGCGFSQEFLPNEVAVLSRIEQALTGRNQTPRLTHVDLQKQNIMYCEKEDGDFDLVIIDWQDMVWLPEWVEPAHVLQAWRGDGIIHEMLEGLYSPSDMEAANFLMECYKQLRFTVYS